jgi:hypothetical protein
LEVVVVAGAVVVEVKLSEAHISVHFDDDYFLNRWSFSEMR